MAQIHHIDRNHQDHDRTIPLCPYHHMNYILPQHSRRDMHEIYGPSLAGSRQAFIKAFGTEEELLAKVNEIIETMIKGGI